MFLCCRRDFLYRRKNFLCCRKSFLYCRRDFLYRRKNFLCCRRHFLCCRKSFLYCRRNFLYSRKSFLYRRRDFLCCLRRFCIKNLFYPCLQCALHMEFLHFGFAFGRNDVTFSRLYLFYLFYRLYLSLKLRKWNNLLIIPQHIVLTRI